MFLSKHIRAVGAALLVCCLLAVLLPPANAASDGEETVRVGWHEPPYYIRDELGRASGYSYEYQQKLAAYTGWRYEYVEGSWSELLQMLKNGEIDMMANVSFMEERSREMLFASLPMGTEAYYLFVSPDNRKISADDVSSLEGKRVGVAKDSIQSELFRRWAEEHSVQTELVELSSPEEESLLLLGKEIDAFVTMDILYRPELAVPVWKIGSSDFFFAVSRDRPDLLAKLNAAMNMIQDENKYYSQELHEKYLSNAEANHFLSLPEINWLSSHGAIRVGYQDGYLAFCARDGETGELIGALKDYLDYATYSMQNARITFETVAYPTAAAAIEALRSGEVDCVFPANLSAFDGERLGLVMTPVLMKTEMDAVVRAQERKEFVLPSQATVAVNEGNTNYEMFLLDHFPGLQTAYFKDTSAGLNAVARGEADCLIISNYRFNNISKQCERLRLAAVYTGVDMDYCLAVRRGDTELYSILAKTIDVVPNSAIYAALTYYSAADVRVGFWDIVRENMLTAVLAVTVVILLILLLLRRSIQAEKKVQAEEQLVSTLNKKVFVDALTSVRNKGAYDEYLRELQKETDGESPGAFAIGVFDCDDLKLINDSCGHDKGDIYLQTASRLICRVFQHSPVFRIGGDEFAVVLQNEDFRNRDELVRQFKAYEADICACADLPWEQVRVALGIAVYDGKLDGSVQDTARRADKIMYENKRLRKEALRSRK